MPDRTPAEILVARLSGVDDPAERVRIAAEALDAVRAEERESFARVAKRLNRLIRRTLDGERDDD